MFFNTHKCSMCEKDFSDGETIYNIRGELFCESCINDCKETFEYDEQWIDDAVDEMRDLRNGW